MARTITRFSEELRFRTRKLEFRIVVDFRSTILRVALLEWDNLIGGTGAPQPDWRHRSSVTRDNLRSGVTRDSCKDLTAQNESLIDLNDDLKTSFASMTSEINALKCNASMLCDSCVALHDELASAKVEIDNIKSLSKIECDSCTKIIAKKEKINLAYVSRVDQLEKAKAEINKFKASSYNMCSLIAIANDDHLTSCNHDKLHTCKKTKKRIEIVNLQNQGGKGRIFLQIKSWQQLDRLFNIGQTCIMGFRPCMVRRSDQSFVKLTDMNRGDLRSTVVNGEDYD
uniref:Uncharacterized protein n=1 Tax=Oryza brachyantha TaxID=4533 RepID=J3LVC4_ORYBR